MADIKQAAKWMREGNRVVREKYPSHAYFATQPKTEENDNIWRSYKGGEPEERLLLRVSDLLADDWELAPHSDDRATAAREELNRLSAELAANHAKLTAK